jgi:cytochrome c-type biogenesis protein CcmH
MSTWNGRLKRWPGWVALLFVLVGFLAVGATRDSGARSAGDRVDDISRRIACPVCDGESVYESRNNASESIRAEIRSQVAAGVASDDRIIDDIAASFGAQVLLVPRSTGLDALVWALPAAALVCALAGLGIAFRRWRNDASAARSVTSDDRALVDAALAAEAALPDGTP